MVIAKRGALPLARQRPPTMLLGGSYVDVVVESGLGVSADSSAGLEFSSWAPLRNSLIELPIERATSGSLVAPKMSNTIARIINSSGTCGIDIGASLPFDSLYAINRSPTAPRGLREDQRPESQHEERANCSKAHSQRRDHHCQDRLRAEESIGFTKRDIGEPNRPDGRRGQTD